MSTRTRNTECSVCGEFFASGTFPRLEQCTHEPTVCRGCFQGWLTAQVADVNWNRIVCPSAELCNTYISRSDMQRLASQETYARYDELSLRSFLSSLPNFRYCLRPGCSSGQIHIEDSNLFRCISCQFLVCTTHNVPFHMGETCAEYDERTHSIENDASNAVIQDTTKQCPGEGCGVHIEKNNGCDHMTCQRCSHEFCWICLAPYRGVAGIWVIGNHAHTRHCIHWRSEWDIPEIEDNVAPIPRARDPLPRAPLPRNLNPLPRDIVPPNPLLRNPLPQDPRLQDPSLPPPRWQDNTPQDPPQPGLPQAPPLPRDTLPQAPPRPAPPPVSAPPAPAPPAPAPPAPAPPAPAPPAPAPPVPVPRRQDPQAIEIRLVARPRNGFWASARWYCEILLWVLGLGSLLICILAFAIEAYTMSRLARG